MQVWAAVVLRLACRMGHAGDARMQRNAGAQPLLQVAELEAEQCVALGMMAGGLTWAPCAAGG